VAAHRGTLTAAAFAPDGSYLVTTGVDGAARIWDTREVSGGTAR